MFEWLRQRLRPTTGEFDTTLPAPHDADPISTTSLVDGGPDADRPDATVALPVVPSDATPSLAFGDGGEVSSADGRPEDAPSLTEAAEKASGVRDDTQASYPAETAPDSGGEAAIEDSSDLVAAPSSRPAMPLDHTDDRRLPAEMALSPDAQVALTILLTDMFGPDGDYEISRRSTDAAAPSGSISKALVLRDAEVDDAVHHLVDRIQDALGEVAIDEARARRKDRPRHGRRAAR